MCTYFFEAHTTSTTIKIKPQPRRTTPKPIANRLFGVVCAVVISAIVDAGVDLMTVVAGVAFVVTAGVVTGSGVNDGVMNPVLDGFTTFKVARPLNTLNKSGAGPGGAGGGANDGVIDSVLDGFTTFKVARPSNTLNKSGAGGGGGAEVFEPIELCLLFGFSCHIS